MAPPLAEIKMMNCLFFEDQAEEAARYYVSIFPSSSVRRPSSSPFHRASGSGKL